MKRAILDRLLTLRAAKRHVALLTDLETGAQALISTDCVEGDLDPTQDQLQSARDGLASDRNGILPGTETLFLNSFAPPLRMVVVGAVHIAQALVPMSRLAGYEVVVVDPRRAWATTERFPDITLTTAWPDDAMAALDLDRRTAVVTLTHDPKLDDPALTAALRSEVFYIGALGSKRTQEKRFARLREAGFSDGELGRIHGPVGLALGALSPAEIAVSILAEVTRVLRGAEPPGSGGPSA